MTEFEKAAGVDPPARPSMKERQRQLREDAILEATMSLLKTKGYDSMTLEDITEAIGISRPTLYQHFKSKEDIVLHLCLRCRIDLYKFMQAQDRGVSAKERLIQFCDYALEMRFSGQGIAFGDMMKVISSMDNEDPVMVDIDTKLMDAYVALAREAQEEGGVRRDMPAEMLSQVIVGFIKNYTFDKLIEEGKITLPEIKDCARKLLIPPAE